jgi:hypothetical protein
MVYLLITCYKVGQHGMILLGMKIQKKKMVGIIKTIKTNQQHIMKDVFNIQISIHIDEHLDLVHHIDEIAHFLGVEDHDQFLESQEIGRDLEMMIDIYLDLDQVVETEVGIETEKEGNHTVVDLDLFLGTGKGLIIEADRVQKVVATDIEADDIKDLIQGQVLTVVNSLFYFVFHFRFSPILSKSNNFDIIFYYLVNKIKKKRFIQ